MSKIVDEVKASIRKFNVWAAVDITPKMAEELLELNIQNRPLKERTVALYTKEMTQGNWQFNGGSIVFSKEGRMIDGQHRLTAIVRSGTTQKFNIQTGLEDGAFATIDIGKVRSAGDVLAIEGHKQSTIMAQAVKLIINYDSNNMLRGKSMEKTERVTHQELLAWVEKRDKDVLAEHVSMGSKYHVSCKLLGSSTYTAFLYLFARKNLSQAKEFFDKFTTGEDISSKKNSPIYYLRQKLINNQGSKTEKYDSVHKYALLVKAWNNWRDHKEISRLYWTSEEGFPKIK